MISLNSWVAGLGFWRKALLAFVLGVLVAGSLAPLHLIFLLPVSFTGLIWLLSSATTRWQAFFMGWWFAWGQFIAGLYWIGVAFTVDAATHAILIPLPVLGLPAFLAILSGLATLATHLLKVKGLSRLLVFSALWIAFEYVRGVIFTGFPWNVVGYAWSAFLPMLQTTAYIGIFGLTLLTVFVSTLPSLLGEGGQSRKSSIIWLSSAACFLILLYGLGAWRLSDAPSEMVRNASLRIVQPNIPQVDKWKAHLRLGHLRKLVALSETETGSDPTHLIWPETAVPYYLTTSRQLKEQLAEFVPPGGAIATGAPRQDPVARQYWNSLQVLNEAGEITDIYDKQHLVPYGEYMPLRDLTMALGLTDLIPALDQMSDFASPDPSANRTVRLPGLPPARAMICYEIVFPWEVRNDEEFSWILNITNDGWFGTTSGPYQHFAATRTRAIEQGVPVIRAANTGISAIIDPYGRVLDRLDLNDTGIIDGALPKPIEAPTFYSRYGEYSALFLTFLTLITGLYLGRRP